MITNYNIPELRNGFEFLIVHFAILAAFEGKNVSKDNMPEGQ